MIVDDVLSNPERWVELAQGHREQFLPAGSENSPAYPGLQLLLPDELTHTFNSFFLTHIRSRLGARHLIRSSCRFSMLTLKAGQLHPAHTICHTDRGGPPGALVLASVLYLYRDEALGGTSFFEPRRTIQETESIVSDSLILPHEDFSRRYGLPRSYMQGGNDYFSEIATVKPRWNRMIFYNGAVFHGASVQDDSLLNAEPLSGRLTINGFFYCKPRTT